MFDFRIPLIDNSLSVWQNTITDINRKLLIVDAATRNMILLLFLCSYLAVLVTSSEYACESDRFPLVTDFGPEDCDNTRSYFYTENLNDYRDCFPGCRQTTTSK